MQATKRSSVIHSSAGPCSNPKLCKKKWFDVSISCNCNVYGAMQFWQFPEDAFVENKYVKYESIVYTVKLKG